MTGGSLTLLCSKKNMKGDKIKIIYILLNKIIFHFSVFSSEILFLADKCTFGETVTDHRSSLQ